MTRYEYVTGTSTMPANLPTPVANPTWYADIRQLFAQTDVDHMKGQGLDLTSYDAVKNSAGDIYGQVSTGNMPPPPHNWPPAWITTFLNWMTNGFPKGTPTSPQTPAMGLMNVAALVTTATRIRKDITTVSAAELASLKAAFSGIMAKDPSDASSYFAQAGYHWLPVGNLFCQHHVPAYNPWHRAYLFSFENALRTVPGCENVTLPYWDITAPFPEVLKSAPFDTYTLPKDVGPGYAAGYVTQRYPYPDIQRRLSALAVTEDLDRALTKTDWEDFHGLIAGANNNTIIAAHDSGHNAIGPTMADQAAAAFDPVFWFFHCNWDRLFWQWQKTMSATNLEGVLTTINKETDPVSYQIFTVPVLQALNPFTGNAPKLDTSKILDSETSLDIDYQDPKTPTRMNLLAKTQRSVLTSQKFLVHADRVNVRVQGVNRLKIPGSFTVHLLKDGVPIASRAFFQPSEVGKCPTCVNNAIVHFDFELPLQDVSNGKLEVWVEPLDKSFAGDHFPNKLMGNPTVDVRFLMSTE
jgi:tyrosinase